jgi:mannosyl-3-phosphoglycerate phosphatase
LLFSDLDGTLLDHHSYQPSSRALKMVELLAGEGISTIPVSSKTAVEVQEIATRISFAGVCVVEGGAAILCDADEIELIGPARSHLLHVLQQLREEGWPVRGFSDMSHSEVVELTGLSRDAALRAMDRLASEPFIVTAESAGGSDGLLRRALELGAEVTRGGRFWHLLGIGIDKGRGIDALIRRMAFDVCPPTGAVGDAWNDLPMFERVDRGYLLGPAVVEEVASNVTRIPETGPAGFVRAGEEFRDFCGTAEGMRDRPGPVASG